MYHSRFTRSLVTVNHQSEGTITQAVRALRKLIAESNEQLRALAEERERRRRKLALDDAYPNRLKTKRGD